MLKKILATIALNIALSLCVNAAEVPNIELNNGTKIPQLGLGTFMLQEGEGKSEAYTATLTALKAGVILIRLTRMETKEVLEEQSKIAEFLVKKFGLHRNCGRQILAMVNLTSSLRKCLKD